MGQGPTSNFTAYNLGTEKSVLKEVGLKVKFKTMRLHLVKHLNIPMLMLVNAEHRGTSGFQTMISGLFPIFLQELSNVKIGLAIRACQQGVAAFTWVL